MEKTTLTISGASAYAAALLEDARISGRTILALQAEPDPRRSGGQAQAEVHANRKPVSPGDAQANPEEIQEDLTEIQEDLTEIQEVTEDTESGAEVQDELETAGQRELGPGTWNQSDSEPARGTASWTEHTVISWNPGSFASTKAALIEAETALGGTVNEAIVFIDPMGTGRRLPELSLGQIEAATTSWITGYTQLLRELGRRFAEHGSGLILVVLLPGERGPLEAMAVGAMEALACSLATQTGEAYRLFAIRDESGQPELLSRYIMKILDEQPRDSSKLMRHGGRINLFGK